jgi:hypothetical protein
MNEEDEEHKWIETNNSVCALLRQAHDVLAMSSFPPRRAWVGLTDEDYASPEAGEYTECFEDGARWAEIKLKEKNT